jgi:hypothetical protein
MKVNTVWLKCDGYETNIAFHLIKIKLCSLRVVMEASALNFVVCAG